MKRNESKKKQTFRFDIYMFLCFLMYGDVKAQSLYHQLGVDSSSADKTNFNNSQGVATQILGKKSQTFSGGGAHYFWVATGIKEPTGTVFSQMGYHISCNNCGMRPFIFKSGASIPASNIFVVYNYFLPDNQYSTFWYETMGFKTLMVHTTGIFGSGIQGLMIRSLQR